MIGGIPTIPNKKSPSMRLLKRAVSSGRTTSSRSHKGGFLRSSSMLSLTLLILLHAQATPAASASRNENVLRRPHGRIIERDDSVAGHLNVEGNFATERAAVGEAVSGATGDSSSSGRLINIPIDPTISIGLNNTNTGDDGANATTTIVDVTGNGNENTAMNNATFPSELNTTTADGMTTINVPTGDIISNSTVDIINDDNNSNNKNITAILNGTLTTNSTNDITDISPDANATDITDTTTNTTVGDNGSSTTLLASDFPSLVPSRTPTSSPMVVENDDVPEEVPGPPQPSFIVDPNDSKYLICNRINGNGSNRNNEVSEQQQQHQQQSEYLVRVKLNYKIWIEEDKVDGVKDSNNNFSALTNTIYDIHAIMAEYVARNVLDCDDSTATTSSSTSSVSDSKGEPSSTRKTRHRRLIRGRQHSPKQVEQQEKLQSRSLTGDERSGNNDSIVKGVYGVSTIPPPKSNDELLPMIIPRQCTHHSNTFADNTFDHECYEVFDIFMTLKSNGDSFLLPDITCGVLLALRTTEFLVFLIQSIPNTRLEAFHIPDDYLPNECRSYGIDVNRIDGNSNDDNISIGSEVAVPVMIGIAIGTTMASVLACCVVWYSVCYVRRRRNDGRDDSNRSGGSSSSGGSSVSRRRGRHGRIRRGARRRRLRHGNSINDGSEKDVFVFEDEFNEDDDDGDTVETFVSPRSVSTEGTSGTNRSIPTPTNAASTNPSLPNQQVGSGDVTVKATKSLYVSTMTEGDKNSNNNNNKENSDDLLGATAPHYHANPKKIKKDQDEDSGIPSPRNRKTKTLKVTRRKKKKSNQNPFILNASRSASGRSSPTSPGSLLHASMMSATAGSSTSPPPPSGPPSPQRQGGLAAYLYGILTPIKEADDSANEVSSQASSTKTDNSNSTPLSNLLDNVLGIGRRGTNGSVSSCSNSSVNSASDNDDDENGDGAGKNKPVEATSLLGIISFDDDGDDERSSNDNDEDSDMDVEEQLDDVYEIPTQHDQLTPAGVAATTTSGEEHIGKKEAVEASEPDPNNHSLTAVEFSADKEAADANALGKLVDDLGAIFGETTTESSDNSPIEAGALTNNSAASETTDTATVQVQARNDARRVNNAIPDEVSEEEAEFTALSETVGKA